MNREISKKKAVYCLIIVSLAYFWSNFHRLSMAVLSPYIMESMGITTAQVGTLGSMLFYVYGLTQIPFGIIADKYGSKRIVQVCLFALVIGTYLFGTAKTYNQLLIGRLITGFAVSGFYVPSLSLIRGWFDIRIYGFFIGIYMSIGNMGSLLASAPFEILLSKFELNSIYLVFGILVLILAIASLFLYEEPHTIVKKEKIKKGETPFPFYTFVASISLLCLLYNGARQGFQSLWGSSYYTSVFGYSTRTASYFLMLFSIGGILFTPIAGRISDKSGKFNALIKLSILSAVMWMIMGFAPVNTPTILIGIFALCLGALKSSTVQNAFTTIGDYSRPEMRSFISSILNTSNFFGSAIYTQTLGIIFQGREMNHTTFFAVFVAFALFILLGIVIVMFQKNRLDRYLESHTL